MITTTLATADLQVPIISNKVTDEELVSGIRGRCKNKFNLLYKMYAPSLMGIISRIVKSEVIAEAALQETFVKIWDSIGDYDASQCKLFTWLAATARNTAIGQQPGNVQLGQLTPNLHASEKEILDLIYFQGFTHSEAAQMLNIPLDKINTKLRLAVNSLREGV